MIDEALKRSMQRATDKALAKMDETDRRFKAEQRERHERASAIGDAITAYWAGDRTTGVMRTLKKNGVQMAFGYRSILEVISGKAPDEYIEAIAEEVSEARKKLGIDRPMTARDVRDPGEENHDPGN